MGMGMGIEMRWRFQMWMRNWQCLLPAIHLVDFPKCLSSKLFRPPARSDAINDRRQHKSLLCVLALQVAEEEEEEGEEGAG